MNMLAQRIGKKESSTLPGKKSTSVAEFGLPDNRVESVAQCKAQALATRSVKSRKFGQSFPDNRARACMQSKMIDGLNNSRVLQRDAFWAVDDESVAANPIPVAQQPAYPHIKRDGGGQDHELHNGVNKARGAARAEANIKVSKSSVRNDASGAQARGSYMYGVEEGSLNHVDPDYLLRSNTNCVMNHTHDNQAELELHTAANNQQDVDTVNHFHAYTFNAGANIRSRYSDAAQPHGNTRLGAEHYFVNPFV